MTQDQNSAPLLVEVSDGLARLTLNRPAQLNAFNADLAHAWANLTVQVVNDPTVKAILIDATGPAFCAGGDIAAMANGEVEESIEELANVISSGLRTLTESSLPVAVAAHGTTAGGGLGVLLSGDYVVAGESSKIGSIYANMGLTPDLSVSEQLSRAVGERRALQLVLMDSLLPVSVAAEWGLVAEVVPDDQVKVRAEAVARNWIAGASAAYGQAKRLIRSRGQRSVADQFAEEARTIGAAYETQEAQVRIHAFAARSARKEAK